MSKVDLMMAVHDRVDFTRETLRCLDENTDWALVDKFTIFDVASKDVTHDMLAVCRYPAQVVRFDTRRHIVDVQHEQIKRATAPLIIKLDNDTIVPPNWLTEIVGVMDRHPELDGLGFEAVNTSIGVRIDNMPTTLPRSYALTQFLGGLHCFRTRAFAASMPVASGQHFGLQTWMDQRKDLKLGWIAPSLNVFLLDRLPLEPWATLTRKYVEQGLQRNWEKYSEADAHLWKWWLNKERAS